MNSASNNNEGQLIFSAHYKLHFNETCIQIHLYYIYVCMYVYVLTIRPIHITLTYNLNTI